MTSNNRSTKPTTRSEFSSRLQSLSTENEELEDRVREAEQKCKRYEMKNNSHHSLIVDLMDAIHSLAKSPTDDIESSISEEMCLLLTKKAKQVSDLSEEVERLKLQVREQTEVARSAIVKFAVHNDDESENDDDDDVDFEDISLCDNENENSSSASLASSSTSLSSDSGDDTTELEDKIFRIGTKCKSLERSLKTLKRKNTEREIRSMKSLRNMRRQVDSLEQERKRRLDLQASAEERVLQLEIEVHQLKQDNYLHDIYRQQPQQPPEDRPESPNVGIVGEPKQIETDPSGRKGIDRCRELIMLRNQLDNDLYPPLLLAVSEESEGSDDDFRPYVDGAVTSE